MAFSWKARKDIFKGEGIYHVTWVVAGRLPLLGKLEPLKNADVARPLDINRRDVTACGQSAYRRDAVKTCGQSAYRRDAVKTCGQSAYRRDVTAEEWERMQTSQLAHVAHTPLGFAVSSDLNHIVERHEGVRLLGKVVMENHIHAVIQVNGKAKKSIRQIGHGFRIGITHIAKDLGVWPQIEGKWQQVEGGYSQADSASASSGGDLMVGSSVGKIEVCHTSETSPGLILEQPFIRTLCRRGQLDAMIKYVHANPDNAWLQRLHPDLYTIRRHMRHGGLYFDTMGKSRLLDYPDRNIVMLSRSLTKEEIETEVQKALEKANDGMVTYCAAINEGERSVTKAIREAGFPLVVMLLAGFPAEGTDAARFYHPGGAYHKVCGEGKLYLMAPLPDNYNDSRLIELTEMELARKSAAKGQRYYGIPHESTRWRMIAGNMMLNMIAKIE